MKVSLQFAKETLLVQSVRLEAEPGDSGMVQELARTLMEGTGRITVTDRNGQAVFWQLNHPQIYVIPSDG